MRGAFSVRVGLVDYQIYMMGVGENTITALDKSKVDFGAAYGRQGYQTFGKRGVKIREEGERMRRQPGDRTRLTTGQRRKEGKSGWALRKPGEKHDRMGKISTCVRSRSGKKT